MLYKETVRTEMWELLQKLMKDEKLKDFNLVGGTALSLKIGHRLSIDIDLFTTKDFDQQKMLEHLANHYPVVVRDLLNNTLLLEIDKIKVDILAHQYPWQKPIQTKEGVRLASLQDIGAMKLHAIFQNGTRIKDFVDMYFLLEHYPLNIYLRNYENKYSRNGLLAAHSLTFFGNIKKEFGVSMISGKEKNFDNMAKRLHKAVQNPKMEFGKPDISNNKGRGFRR